MNNKILVRIVFFTENGENTAKLICDRWKDCILEFKPQDQSLMEWTKECFELHLPIIFVGSAGIAVRAIAPFVSDKLKDSPVLVVDELGMNVIPILSGHFGRANELALRVASAINSNPVITTATDINDIFSVDYFAKKNGFGIHNKKAIKYLSTKLLNSQQILFKCKLKKYSFVGIQPNNVLEGEPFDFLITENEKDFYDKETCLVMRPKRLVLGMGCKKGKSFEELYQFVNKYYADLDLEDNLFAIASADVKAEEIGLLKLAQYYGVPLLTYSPEELASLEGNFQDSDFVKEQIGVGNVCERAAMLTAGEGGTLVKSKLAENGMTLAVANRGVINIVW